MEFCRGSPITGDRRTFYLWINNYDILDKLLPKCRFIGEEETASGKKVELTDSPTWIIDPVDGTMNFVHGFPHSSISVALWDKKVARIGVVYNPVLDQLFTARQGQGAFMNGKPIKVSGQKGLYCIDSHVLRKIQRRITPRHVRL